MNLRALGEDRLLEKITAGLPRNRFVVAGAGDDCAVVRSGDELFLLKTDSVVEGVHFDADAPAAAVGWKAMARPLSDIAAMSGLPKFALVTLIVPPTTPLRWITGIYRGLTKAASAVEVAIVGGETSATAGPAAISISLVGGVEPERLVRRSGGKVGDALFVTGQLGGSIRGKHLRFMPRIAESRWLTQHFQINAMMDLSDGLGADLPRLARASGVGFAIDQNALPRTRGCTIEQAVSDGEDYELLFAVSPKQASRLELRWRKQFPSLRLSRIGQFNQKSKIRTQKFPSGYVHFQ